MVASLNEKHGIETQAAPVDKWTKLLVLIGTALGVTTIWNSGVVGDVVSPTHFEIYHWSGPSSSLFLPAFLDLCIPWLLLTLLLLATQRPGRLRATVWSGVALSCVFAGLQTAVSLSQRSLPSGTMIAIFGIFSLAVVILFVSWRAEFEPRFLKVQNVVTTLLLCAGIGGVIFLGELGWSAWQARALNTPLPLHSPQSAPAVLRAGQPRIVWILMDELSYQQVYERPVEGLKLPAFDELATEATVFTHTIPAGFLTQMVMPSLIMGKPLNDVRFSATGQLSVHSPAGKWSKFDQHATVFQDAINAGYNTAISGWYNPYCRILPQVLDHCFWRSAETSELKILPYDSVARNMLWPYLNSYPGLGKLANKLGWMPLAADRSVELHISDFLKISSEADPLLRNPANNFILIHVPIPPPPGIYDRTKGVFAVRGSTYIDNLALADRYLAYVRFLLEQQGQWDSSAVLIMGDHSWRTKGIWAQRPDWTKEEQAASQGGRFDDRPAYIVKLPQQHTGYRIDDPFPAIHTRALIDALMNGSVSSPQALSAWVKAHP